MKRKHEPVKSRLILVTILYEGAEDGDTLLTILVVVSSETMRDAEVSGMTIMFSNEGKLLYRKGGLPDGT
jgi:hypothetical protein